MEQKRLLLRETQQLHSHHLPQQSRSRSSTIERSPRIFSASRVRLQLPTEEYAKPDGFGCIHLPEQGSGWHNNYFCWKSGFSDPHVRWSQRGPITNLKCTKIIEPSDPDTWNNNYLGVPRDSKFHFYWTNACRIAGRHCVQWNNSAEDPHIWHDNYLCADQY